MNLVLFIYWIFRLGWCIFRWYAAKKGYRITESVSTAYCGWHTWTYFGSYSKQGSQIGQCQALCYRRVR